MEWGLFVTIIGTGVTIIGALYGIIRNFKKEVNEKFEVQNHKFEVLENRIFQVAMGKSLKDILLQERTKKKVKGE